HPATVGGLAWPRETEHMRHEIQQAMERVPEVLEEAIDDFARIFGRRPKGAVTAEHIDDADTVVIASNTIARTARNAVEERRGRGEKIGLISSKMFRPFPRNAFRKALAKSRRAAVLDRNHSPGSGGIFWQEIAASVHDRP